MNLLATGPDGPDDSDSSSENEDPRDSPTFRRFNDADDSDSDGLDGQDDEHASLVSPDLVGEALNKQKKKLRQQGQTRIRQSEKQLNKIANQHNAPSQYNPLSIAFMDFLRMMMGIPRKKTGDLQNSEKALPDPPTTEEIEIWEQHKIKIRTAVASKVERARRKYLEKYPLAKQSQVLAIEQAAAQRVMENFPPVKFTSRVISDPGHKYSRTVASACEAALALAGLPRCAGAWLSSVRSSWNESLFRILVQEWEKAYHAGNTSLYDIDARQVTTKNLLLICDRWFPNKQREYVGQARQQRKISDNPFLKEELLAKELKKKEKLRGSQARKRVSFFLFLLWLKTH